MLGFQFAYVSKSNHILCFLSPPFHSLYIYTYIWVTIGLDTKVGLENVARLALTEFGLEHGPILAISMVRLEILLAWIKYEHTLLVE